MKLHLKAYTLIAATWLIGCEKRAVEKIDPHLYELIKIEENTPEGLIDAFQMQAIVKLHLKPDGTALLIRTNDVGYYEEIEVNWTITGNEITFMTKKESEHNFDRISLEYMEVRGGIKAREKNLTRFNGFRIKANFTDFMDSSVGAVPPDYFFHLYYANEKWLEPIGTGQPM